MYTAVHKLFVLVLSITILDIHWAYPSIENRGYSGDDDLGGDDFDEMMGDMEGMFAGLESLFGGLETIFEVPEQKNETDSDETTLTDTLEDIDNGEENQGYSGDDDLGGDDLGGDDLGGDDLGEMMDGMMGMFAGLESIFGGLETPLVPEQNNGEKNEGEILGDFLSIFEEPLSENETDNGDMSLGQLLGGLFSMFEEPQNNNFA